MKVATHTLQKDFPTTDKDQFKSCNKDSETSFYTTKPNCCNLLPQFLQHLSKASAESWAPGKVSRCFQTFPTLIRRGSIPSSFLPLSPYPQQSLVSHLFQMGFLTQVFGIHRR